MTKPFWPLAINTWGDEELAAAHRVIDSGRLTMGEEVTAFEREFAAYVGSRYAVMVNSGSSANLLAVAVMQQHRRPRPSAGLQHGLSALVPAIGWATTYAPLHQHGYALRVVDVDLRTLNVTARSIENSLGSSVDAIVSVSVLGNPAPVDTLRKIADSRGLFFIEDNCESMGARIGDRFCGTFGHIGTFSTFFSHHISTGEGGMLVTDDDDLYELAVCLRAHGWARNLSDDSPLRERGEIAGDYQFLLPGYNLRPTELAAAVGRVQLRRLNDMNRTRIANWFAFMRQFDDSSESIMRQHSLFSAHPVPFGFTLVFQNVNDRTEAAGRLRGVGIEYRMITGGCFTEHPSARHYHWSAPDLPHATHAHHCGLFVGNHPFDLTEQIERMIEVLQS